MRATEVGVRKVEDGEWEGRWEGLSPQQHAVEPRGSRTWEWGSGARRD
jgi:hypothetical protein